MSNDDNDKLESSVNDCGDCIKNIEYIGVRDYIHHMIDGKIRKYPRPFDDTMWFIILTICQQTLHCSKRYIAHDHMWTELLSDLSDKRITKLNEKTR